MRKWLTLAVMGLSVALLVAFAPGPLGAVCAMSDFDYRVEFEPVACSPARETAARFWERNWSDSAAHDVDRDQQKAAFVDQQRGVVVEARVRRAYRRPWDAVGDSWRSSDLAAWPRHRPPTQLVHLPEVSSCSDLEVAERWLGSDDAPCCDHFPSRDLVCQTPARWARGAGGAAPPPPLVRFVDVHPAGRWRFLHRNFRWLVSCALLVGLGTWLRGRRSKGRAGLE